MTESETLKDRLLQYLKFKNITVSRFEKTIQAGGSYIKNVRTIGSDKLLSISQHYPDLDMIWLITGNGDMLKNDSPDSQTQSNNVERPALGLQQYSTGDEILRLPLLPVSAQGGSLNDFVISVKDIDCEKIISPIKGADFAITITGESMAPEYPSGSQVLVKKINEEAFIDWGRVYVLDTRNGIVVKKVAPSEKERCIKCISTNPAPEYVPFDVRMDDILGMYRVLLCMSMK
jgi:phage repressor protein C with HTH and peptisase S24 domain